MTFARTALLGTAVALSAVGMTATSAAAAPTDGPPGGQGAAATQHSTTSGDVGASAVTKHVWRNAPSFYWDTDAVGTLYAGDNYFYCQAKGSTHTVGDYANNWWLKTDDDSGNTNVWVNAVNISGGANFEPIDDVPYC